MLNTYSVLTISGFKSPLRTCEFPPSVKGFWDDFPLAIKKDSDQVNVIKAQFSFTHFNYSHSGCNQLLLSSKALI